MTDIVTEQQAREQWDQMLQMDPQGTGDLLGMALDFQKSNERVRFICEIFGVDRDNAPDWMSDFYSEVRYKIQEVLMIYNVSFTVFRGAIATDQNKLFAEIRKTIAQINAGDYTLIS